MIDSQVPISLAESVSHCVGLVLLDQKQSGGQHALSDYEIEIRIGGVSLKANERAVDFLNGCSDEYVPLPPREPVDETTKFTSGVSDEVFERATEEIINRLEPLCASITPVSTHYVTRCNEWRYEADPATGATVRTCKRPLGKHCDFLKRADGDAPNTRDAWWRAAVRVAVCHEATESVANSPATNTTDRLKRRRSVYLYDSTALAPNANTWLGIDDVTAYLAEMRDCLPINCWRIDFTRINANDFQIELELNLGDAMSKYGAEYERTYAQYNKPDANGRHAVLFTRYRILAALGECLFRVEHAMNPGRSATWCRKY